MDNTARAGTMTSAQSEEDDLYLVQLSCTGSRLRWSDIVILNALADIGTKNLVTFSQWPSFLGKQNFEQLVGYTEYGQPNYRSLNINNILTNTILHELMHSAVVPNPTCNLPLSIHYYFSLNAYGWV